MAAAFIGGPILVGAMNNISGVVRQSVIHLSTPDQLRGRVTAIGSIFIGSSKELGAIRSGFMAALLGPVASVVIGAAGTIFVVALVDRVWPGTRKIPHFHQLRRNPVDGGSVSCLIGKYDYLSDTTLALLLHDRISQ